MDILYTWSGFSTKKKAIIIGVFAFIVLAVVLTLCLTSGYKATTMRLLRMQGTVTLVTSSGSTKEPKGNMRFSSGDSLATGEDGLATIALDDDKIITLQSNSRAEFSKSRKKIEMTLTQGALYFNVTKPLEGDETFDIKTSTMIVGIRGTSGYIYVDRNGNPTVILTDGHVHVTGVNPSNGETKEADVYAGQRLSVFILSGTGETVVFSLDNIAPEDLPQGALDVIANNAALLERVCADTGWDPDYIKALAKGETEEEPTEPEETVATPTPTTAPDSTATPTPTPTPADEDDDDDDWDDDDWDPTPTPRSSGSDSGNSSSDDDDDNSGSGSGSATNTPTPRPTSSSATATPTPRPTSTSAQHLLPDRLTRRPLRRGRHRRIHRHLFRILLLRSRILLHPNRNLLRKAAMSPVAMMNPAEVIISPVPQMKTAILSAVIDPYE